VQQILLRGLVNAGTLAHNFYGDLAVQDFVARAIDGAHAAFANLRSDVVMA
jgi:hypothetical protein